VTRKEAEDKLGPVVEEILSRLRRYGLQEQETGYDREVLPSRF
jgi:hypothetical protein